jgi:UrcA family protein
LENYHVRRVSYADLNLQSEAGRTTLVHRVKGAIRNVCAESLTLPAPWEYSACRLQAWQGAKTQMDRAFARSSTQVAITIGVIGSK